MKTPYATFASVLLANALVISVSAQTTVAPTSVTPNPRMIDYEWMALSDWYKMHADDVAVATKGEAPLVFIGDSITQGWNGAGKVYWEKNFAPLGAVNLGIGGDMTQNLVWRLKYGATGKLDPKAVVLLIGTNNLSFTKDKPEEIAAGVIDVVETLKTSYANADILVMGVFPRNEKPDNFARAIIKKINSVISRLEADDRVTYLDLSEKLLNQDGTISKDVMPDHLHLSEEGYKRWSDAILPWVSERIKP